jgi:chromosome segregation ATPase
VACEKSDMAQTAKMCNSFITTCNEIMGPERFSDLCGNNKPQNYSKHPMINDDEAFNEGVITITSPDLTPAELQEFQENEGFLNQAEPQAPVEVNANKPPTPIKHRKREKIETDASLMKANGIKIWENFRKKNTTKRTNNTKTPSTQPTEKPTKMPTKTATQNNTNNTKTPQNNTQTSTTAHQTDLEKLIAEIQSEQTNIKQQTSNMTTKVESIEKSTMAIATSHRQLQQDVSSLNNNMSILQETISQQSKDMKAMYNFMQNNTTTTTDSMNDSEEIICDDWEERDDILDDEIPSPPSPSISQRTRAARAAGTKRKNVDKTPFGLTKPKVVNITSDATQDSDHEMSTVASQLG